MDLFHPSGSYLRPIDVGGGQACRRLVRLGHDKESSPIYNFHRFDQLIDQVVH